MGKYYNVDALAGPSGLGVLAAIVDRCEAFAARLPIDDDMAAAFLQILIEQISSEVRSGRLCLARTPLPAAVVRLYKARLPGGRLKLQLFALGQGEAHPPHAHQNLLSCQIVLAGAVRVEQFSLMRRIAPGEIEMQPEPSRRLGPGEGVFTTLRHNNLHWQEGLVPGTVLLNINWQGFDPAPVPEPVGRERPEMRYGRRYVDMNRARPSGRGDFLIVPDLEAGQEGGGPEPGSRSPDLFNSW